MSAGLRPDETSEKIAAEIAQTPAPAVAKPPKTYVLYHGSGCLDGFTAAWCAYRALGDRAAYVGVQFHEPFPLMHDGSDVLIFDFTYPRDELLALKARMNSVLLIDHHKTSAEKLAGLDFVRVDQTRSGAMLAWEHFFPGVPAPKLVQWVQDGDLWTWELSHSRAVNAGLRSYPFSFKLWDDLMANPDPLIPAGEALIRFEQQIFEKALRAVRFEMIDGHKVPVINSNVFKSEFGSRLCRSFPDAPFVAIYHDRKDNRVWSLRSRAGGFDVETVARKFGGGGHPTASGFSSTREWPS